MKFISWDIDSINAALTSTSARSELSRNVLEMIKQEDADIIAIQETKLPEAGLTDKQREILLSYFPNYKIELVSSAFPAKKSYAEQWCFIRIPMRLRYPSLQLALLIPWI